MRSRRKEELRSVLAIAYFRGQGEVLYCRLPSPDQFHVALGLVLAVEVDCLFDLGEFGLDPRILDVAVGMQFCKCLQAQLSAAVVD